MPKSLNHSIGPEPHVGSPTLELLSRNVRHPGIKKKQRLCHCLSQVAPEVPMDSSCGPAGGARGRAPPEIALSRALEILSFKGLIEPSTINYIRILQTMVSGFPLLWGSGNLIFIVYLSILYLYCTILYYTILYYTILYCTILYYTILYYTILYYTILYYTILYYTILYYHIPQGSSFVWSLGPLPTLATAFLAWQLMFQEQKAGGTRSQLFWRLPV